MVAYQSRKGQVEAVPDILLQLTGILLTGNTSQNKLIEHAASNIAQHIKFNAIYSSRHQKVKSNKEQRIMNCLFQFVYVQQSMQNQEIEKLLMIYVRRVYVFHMI